jgi:hypothetical protein
MRGENGQIRRTREEEQDERNIANRWEEICL